MYACVKLIMIFVLMSFSFASASVAGPACGLERWILNLNETANTYVTAIGTEKEVIAANADVPTRQADQTN